MGRKNTLSNYKIVPSGVDRLGFFHMLRAVFFLPAVFFIHRIDQITIIELYQSEHAKIFLLIEI